MPHSEAASRRASLSPLRVPVPRFGGPPPLRDSVRALRSMGDWLTELGRDSWDSWATFTFGPRFGPTGPTPDRAMYHFSSWLTSLPGPDPLCFAAVEAGRLGRVHLHALIGPIDAWGKGIPRKALWRSWFRRFGRCQLRPYEPERGCEWYLCKYLTKAPLHWDVWGSINT